MWQRNLKRGLCKESIEKYLALFKGVEEAENGIKYLAKTLEGYLDPEVERNLLEIIDTVEGAKAASFKWYLIRLWFVV